MTYRLDGYDFHDNIEADRYLMLKHMKMNDKIKEFKVHPKVMLVQPYRRCPCCNVNMGDKMCKTCKTITYSSNGVRFYISFLVIENDDRKVLERVMSVSETLSHEFNIKRILYDQICTLPFRIVIDNIRHVKTVKGWVKEHHASV